MDQNRAIATSSQTSVEFKLANFIAVTQERSNSTITLNV